jgi:hypothetical protein
MSSLSLSADTRGVPRWTWLAQVLGVVLDVIGRDFVSVTFAIWVGCVLLIVVAALVDWFQTPTLDHKRQTPRQPASEAFTVGTKQFGAHMSTTQV